MSFPHFLAHFPLNFPTFPWSQAVGQGEQGEASGAREPQEVLGEVAWRRG